MYAYTVNIFCKEDDEDDSDSSENEDDPNQPSSKRQRTGDVRDCLS